MIWLKRTLFTALICVLFMHLHGQDTISLLNPSFEGIEQCCNPPFFWDDCGGFLNETPVDVQPSGAFGVNCPAHHEKTYMGMVTRRNNTWSACPPN